jgi:hypothetical protein
MVSQTASGVRAAAFRSRCFSLAKTCSIGLRSGEYLGRKMSLAPALALMTAEIVHDDDVARLQGWNQHALDIDPEAFAVDRAIDLPWRLDAIVAQSGDEGHGLPVPMRDLRFEPAPLERPASQRRHIGLGPGLVEKDQGPRINTALILGPLLTPSRDVRTVLLASHQSFF